MFETYLFRYLDKDYLNSIEICLGNFKMSGTELRKNGINRSGNLLIPNQNYCSFEDWVKPILDKCLEEQKTDTAINWTPSKVLILIKSIRLAPKLCKSNSRFG